MSSATDQHMSSGKFLAASWSFVAAILVWLWIETEWQWFIVAAGVSALVAWVGAAFRGRWGGALLMLAALALGAAAIFAAYASRGPEGGSNYRVVAVVLSYVVLLGLPLVAIVTFIAGLSRWMGSAPVDSEVANPSTGYTARDE